MNPINAATTTSTSNTGSSSQSTGTGINQLTGNDFLTLLTAQLKSQDPTAPTDPDEFVNQLVSFNSLQQLIQLNQGMTQLDTAATPAASTSASGAQSNTQAAANAAQQIASL
jgi:flagellar basal-body rod modification protein FlgD